jgi:hypothetical protein
MRKMPGIRGDEEEHPARSSAVDVLAIPSLLDSDDVELSYIVILSQQLSVS